MGDPYARAHEQAQRLAPRGIDPDSLREAIWHRSIVGPPPTDDEVREYIDRCERLRQPVSGRRQNETPIRPVERYSCEAGSYVLEQQTRAEARGGRATWVAVRVGTRELVRHARSRIRVRRDLEALHPGGTWSHTLTTRERREIEGRWGL